MYYEYFMLIAGIFLIFIYAMITYFLYYTFKTIENKLSVKSLYDNTDKIISLIETYLNDKIIYENIDNLLKILETSKEIAFRKVYFDDILIYHGSGYKLSVEELDKYGRKYVRLVFDLCGNDIRDKLVKLMGYEALCMRLLDEFATNVSIRSSNVISQNREI